MKFKQFKNDYFAGDEEAALKELVYEGNTHDFKFTKDFSEYQKILATLTVGQKLKYFKFLKEEIKIRPEVMINIAKESNEEDGLNISEEEFLNLKKNPYKAKMLKAFLGFVISGAFIVFGGFMTGKMDADFLNQIQNILPAFQLYFTTTLGVNIINYFIYRKTQKLALDHQSNYSSESLSDEEVKNI